MRGRGLCSHCYQTAWATGDLIDYPRATRSRNDLLDDYVILRAEGHTGQQIAQRLGMTYPAFERALQRARRDGDPRAAPDTPWRVREAS